MEDFNKKEIEISDDPYLKLKRKKEDDLRHEAELEKAQKKKARTKKVFLSILASVLAIICIYVLFIPPAWRLCAEVGLTGRYRMKVELLQEGNLMAELSFSADRNYVRIHDLDYKDAPKNNYYWDLSDDKIYGWSEPVFDIFYGPIGEYKRYDATQGLIGRKTVSSRAVRKNILAYVIDLQPVNIIKEDLIENLKVKALFGKYLLTGQIKINGEYYDINITIDRIGFMFVSVPWE